MTHKDYELIVKALKTAADRIRICEPEDAQKDLLDGIGYAADYLVDSLASDNPRFDRTKFLKACGIAE